MSESLILTENVEGIAIVRLNRPPANPLNIELIEALGATMDSVAQDENVRAAILTGTGSCFCAGLDVKAIPEYSPQQMRRMIMSINRMCLTMYSLLKPLVVAVDGHAIGGGLVMAMMADYRLVTDADCRLGLAEVKAGLPFPACPLEVMKAEMRPEVMRRLSLTGTEVSPDEAVSMGLFDEKAATGALMERAKSVATGLTAHPAASYRVIKNQLRVAAIVRMTDIVEREADPLLGQWNEE